MFSKHRRLRNLAGSGEFTDSRKNNFLAVFFAGFFQTTVGLDIDVVRNFMFVTKFLILTKIEIVQVLQKFFIQLHGCQNKIKPGVLEKLARVIHQSSKAFRGQKPGRARPSGASGRSYYWVTFLAKQYGRLVSIVEGSGGMRLVLTSARGSEGMRFSQSGH